MYIQSIEEFVRMSALLCAIQQERGSHGWQKTDSKRIQMNEQQEICTVLFENYQAGTVIL